MMARCRLPWTSDLGDMHAQSGRLCRCEVYTPSPNQARTRAPSSHSTPSSHTPRSSNPTAPTSIMHYDVHSPALPYQASGQPPGLPSPATCWPLHHGPPATVAMHTFIHLAVSRPRRHSGMDAVAFRPERVQVYRANNSGSLLQTDTRCARTDQGSTNA